MTVKRLLCVLLVISLLVVPVSADYDSYYEVEPVVSRDLGDTSLLSMGVNSVSSGDSGISTMNLTTGESQQLADIRNALVAGYSNATSSSILGLIRSIKTNTDGYASYLQTISNAITSNADQSIFGCLSDIEYAVEPIRTYISNLSLLGDITSSADSILQDTTILADASPTVLSCLASILTSASSLDTNFTNFFYLFELMFKNGNHRYPILIQGESSFWAFDEVLGSIPSALVFDGSYMSTGERTLYGRIKQLQEVLASDDDLALANSQKDNREEIEDSFLSGSSGGTSLGKSDFGALSDVGGVVKETISLNGQSSVGDFTSGLAGADEVGQGWFSESTRAALDSVSSAASYSLRDDPYNMSGWQDRYAWVEGE